LEWLEDIVEDIITKKILDVDIDGQVYLRILMTFVKILIVVRK
jgi:hypothetical protein